MATMTTTVVSRAPLSLVYFHRLAKEGKADSIIETKGGRTIVSFLITSSERDRFPSVLRDATSFWICYRRKDSQ